MCGSLKNIFQEYLFSLLLFTKLHRGFSSPNSHDLRVVLTIDCLLELPGDNNNNNNDGNNNNRNK